MPELVAASSRAVPAASSSSSLVAKSGSWLAACSSAQLAPHLLLDRVEGLRLLGHDLLRPQQMPAERRLHRRAHRARRQRSRRRPGFRQIALGQRADLGALDLGVLERLGDLGEACPLAASSAARLIVALVGRQQLLDLALLGRAVEVDPAIVGAQVGVADLDLAQHVLRPQHQQGDAAVFRRLVGLGVGREVGRSASPRSASRP